MQTLDDERRWQHAHVILSLHAVAPLYEYMGIPFFGEAAEPFQVLLAEYVRRFYLEPERTADFETTRDFLLEAIDKSFGDEWLKGYVFWFLHVWIDSLGQDTDGLAHWRTIFMCCSIRDDWWTRLGFAADKSELVRMELRDAKQRIEDARELASPRKTYSRWDMTVMNRFGFDEKAQRSGEPFNSPVLTAEKFQFWAFWNKMLGWLSVAQRDALYQAAKLIAVDVEIDPASLFHPSEICL